MKNLFILISLIGVMGLLTACGSSKKASAYDYSVQQHSNEISSRDRQPARTKRDVDECILLANTEDDDKFRAYGTATSFQEEYALQNAEANAVIALVQRMETTVEGARQFYNKNSNVNSKKITEGDAQSIVNQYLEGKCKNYRVIKTSLYDLSDNSIQCYVCIELRNTKDDIIKTVDNALTKEDLISVDYDKERFLNSMKQGFEDYKKQKKQK